MEGEGTFRRAISVGEGSPLKPARLTEIVRVIEETIEERSSPSGEYVRLVQRRKYYVELETLRKLLHGEGKADRYLPNPEPRQSYSSLLRDELLQLESEFRTLVSAWRDDTGPFSSVSQMVLHPAYLRIVGMGEKVLPLLFRELRDHPDHWFAALCAITGQNPVPSDEAGSIDAMVERWLKWAVENGYLGAEQLREQAHAT
jgi:hypothetical protein